MSIVSFNPVPNAPTNKSTTGRGFDKLGQADFIRLMTVQMKHQDPFAPMDNKEMLAQMAQFSTLSGTTDMGKTLKEMSAKLDKLIAAQNKAGKSSDPAAAAPAASAPPAASSEATPAS